MLSIAVALNFNSALAETEIEEFAFQSQLSSSDEILQRVELPIEMLLSLTRDDLGDLLVFDNAGKPVPSWVRQKPPQITTEQVDLIFHPFSTFREMHSKTVSTRQIQNQHNQTSELQTIETVPIQSTRRDYIIELTRQQQQPGLKHIQLRWKHEPVDQMLKIRVEVGNDLDHWRIIHGTKNLTNKNPDKGEWSRIEAIPGGYKYIRLTALKPVQSFELLQVSAVYEYKKPNEPLWHTLAVLTADEKHEGLYQFTLPKGLRAHQIRLKPSQQQSFIKGDLYASHEDLKHKITVKRNWQQHSFNQSNEIQASKPIPVKSFNYNNWWFYTHQTLDNPPDIEIAFPVYEILFLSNDKGPFTLAWGNYDATEPANDLAGILARSDQQTYAERVSLTEIRIAGGESRLSPGKSRPWLKWSLWLLLFVAVLITGRMATGLYRDMNPE